MVSKQEWSIIAQNMWDKCWVDKYILNIGTEEAPIYLVQDPSQKGQMVSEGMSYGLLLCITMTRLFPHRSKEFENVFYGLLKGLELFGGGALPYWTIVKQGDTYIVPEDQKATASDAEVVIAWALLEAEEFVRKKKWREISKDLYLKKALRILKEIREAEVKKIPCNWGERLFLKPSREWGKGKNINEVVINPSYLWLPAFQKFAKYDKKNRGFWQKIYKDSIWLFEKIINKRGQIFDWARAQLAPAGDINFSSLGQGLSFMQTFDGVRSLFILGMDKQKKLCKLMLKGKKIDEVIITPEKPTKALAQASLLALAYGAKDKKAIKSFSEKVISHYHWDEGYFGDRKDRYYNNTLILFLVAKIILGA